MSKVLQSSLPIAQTMSLLPDEIHTQGSTSFGLVTQLKKRISTFSRRTLLSIKLVQEKKHLSGQILNCREEEKEGLHSLLESVRVRLRNLRKKENKRNVGKKRFGVFSTSPFQIVFFQFSDNRGNGMLFSKKKTMLEHANRVRVKTLMYLSANIFHFQKSSTTKRHNPCVQQDFAKLPEL